jgi:integrase/recombinase XerC
VTALFLAVDAGFRSGEVRALEVRDVDFGNHQIILRRTLSEDEEDVPKGKDERRIPMTARLEARMEMACKGKIAKARVVQEDGETPTRQRILTVLHRHLKSVGLPQKTFHSKRHAFVSDMLSRGASAEAVRELAGHSSLTQTQDYAHAAAGDLQKAIAVLGR